MKGTTWIESMLDFTGSKARDNERKPRSRDRATRRLAYVDSVKLEQYRAWLKARVTAAERSLPAAKR